MGNILTQSHLKVLGADLSEQILVAPVHSGGLLLSSACLSVC